MHMFDCLDINIRCDVVLSAQNWRKQTSYTITFKQL